MVISLLYTKQMQAQRKPTFDRLIYHLSLDRAFSYICADVKKREFFLSVISNITDDKNEILYRQEILKDFENNPSLLEQLSSLSVRFGQLCLSQKHTEKDENVLSANSTYSSAAAKNILQTRAVALKRALLFVKAYGELLDKFEFKSKGLEKLNTACKDIYEKTEFSRLITFCSKYENFSENGFLDFKFSLDENGRIEKYELIDHGYIHVTDPEVKSRSFPFFKKSEQETYPCARVNLTGDEFFENLAASSFSDISNLFCDIAEQIFEYFGELERELTFYDVALKYINALNEKQVPICYPIFSENRSITVKKLYDLYLLMSKLGHDVVPNDFVLNENGLLLFGNNGSGKTVYLRSVGTMQILAQAGLPVPCEYAETTVFSQIATQFSEAEKEFCEGNDAGRFEQEVRELAEMVDTLKEGALVFLNETFQSTAYTEGAEGLYNLLKYFSELDIRWILVSHLRQIEKMFDAEKVTVLHTSEGYNIC